MKAIDRSQAAADEAQGGRDARCSQREPPQSELLPAWSGALRLFNPPQFLPNAWWITR